MRINHTVINQVPPNYYQQSVKTNAVQKNWHMHKLDEVRRLIPVNFSKKKSNILDVGSASGWFLSQIANLFPNATCYGIDIHKKAITYGKRIYPTLKLRVSNAERLPYKNNFFDIVVCTSVLEHVHNPEKVLLEIKRVMKKNGMAIIELDTGSILFSLLWFVWRKMKGRVWNDSHLHSFSVADLEKIILNHKFRIQNKKTFNYGMQMVFKITK